MQAQIDGHNKDLASDFKNIKKRYMDQLIKVKMSDMANNDLEKYAKALDRSVYPPKGEPRSTNLTPSQVPS